MRETEAAMFVLFRLVQVVIEIDFILEANAAFCAHVLTTKLFPVAVDVFENVLSQDLKRLLADRTL